MITRLLPEQVANFWDIIKYGIEETLPPVVGEHKDKMNRILGSLLNGRLTCWASYRRENEQIIFEGICVTTFSYDESSGTKDLLIYCVYGYNKTIKETWTNGYIPIAKYAKSHKCNRIIGYTDDPGVLEIVKMFGGKTRTFISIDIDEYNKTIGG